jgi:exopolysaccharide biosynthesis polyprenyl glycosylphosphotransferase
MKPSLKRRQFALFLIDVVVLYAALYVALVLRHGDLPSVESWTDHAYQFSYIFAVWLVIFYISRFYAFDLPFTSVRFASRLSIAMGIAILSTVLYFYLLPSAPIKPKTVLVVYSFTAYLFILSWRWLYMALSRLSPVRTRIAVIGASPESWELLYSLEERPQLGYSIAFMYSEEEDARERSGMVVHTRPDFLRMAFDQLPVTTVVMADHVALSMEARRVLFDQVERGVRFERLQNFYEMYMRRVPLGVISEAWFLENIDLRAKRPYLLIKRCLDILLGLAFLPVIVPLLPFLALIIKLESKGPVLFSQVRLGQHGRCFTIYKFRTMRTEDNDQTPTGIGDSRITGFGSFMRKTRLDELPQIFNILQGHMSFVGPRPERPELAKDLELVIPFYKQRHLVKPGITGWDQVSGEYHSPSAEDTYKKLQYDLYYVKNLSIFLDLSIFFKTIMTVFSRQGR